MLRYQWRLLLILLGLQLQTCKTPQKHEEASELLTAELGSGGPDEDAIVPGEARDSLLKRSKTLAQTSLQNGSKRSLLEGPEVVKWKNGKLERQTSREFKFNEVVECEYLNPWLDDKPGGKTPKFYCNATRAGAKKAIKLKVKYDSFESPAVNTGVYGEVLATRLFWELGFLADTVFPVQVICNGCPTEPWKHITLYWELLEAENALSRMTLGSGGYNKQLREMQNSAVRYILETLKRYNESQSLRSKRDGDVSKIYDEQEEVLFDSTSGNLTVKGQTPVKVFDPATKLLVKTSAPGYEDYLINHLPASVWEDLTPRKGHYVSAIIEAKHASIPIENRAKQGWSLGIKEPNTQAIPDIRKVDTSKAELVKERQELALLAAFIGHADNKDEQQRFVCLDSGKIEAEDDDCKSASKDPRSKLCKDGTNQTFTTCDDSRLMIQDLGFTFGYGSRVTGTDSNGRNIYDSSPKERQVGTADPKGFLEAKIFGNEKDCITTVNPWATGVNIEEKISEPARASLVSKLKLLAADETRLTQLFQSARLHLKKRHAEGRSSPAIDQSLASKGGGAGGDDEKALVDEFKNAFRKKVARLEQHRCP
jgi:hypothetical protein